MLLFGEGINSSERGGKDAFVCKRKFLWGVESVQGGKGSESNLVVVETEKKERTGNNQPQREEEKEKKKGKVPKNHESIRKFQKKKAPKNPQTKKNVSTIPTRELEGKRGKK